MTTTNTNTTATTWICTDPDTYQHARQLSETEFEFVQMEATIMDDYNAYTGIVDVMDYLTDREGQEKLRVALGMYGYSGWLDLESRYGKDTFRIAAECIFEVYMTQSPDHSAYTEEECREWLDDYMKDNLF